MKALKTSRKCKFYMYLKSFAKEVHTDILYIHITISSPIYYASILLFFLLHLAYDPSAYCVCRNFKIYLDHCVV